MRVLSAVSCVAVASVLRGGDVDETQVAMMGDPNGQGTKTWTEACDKCENKISPLNKQGWCSQCYTIETNCAFKSYARKTVGSGYDAKKEVVEQACGLDESWYWACNVDTTKYGGKWRQCTTAN
mmetsp:Transcript_35483/g.77601  ORF Transcript_35483/g.77601 Transcript_35483/m.77601 type:complete len:124 (+) Transcript_35483:72-443(+)